jgi:hypothetical protein
MMPASVVRLIGLASPEDEPHRLEKVSEATDVPARQRKARALRLDAEERVLRDAMSSRFGARSRLKRDDEMYGSTRGKRT